MRPSDVLLGLIRGLVARGFGSSCSSALPPSPRTTRSSIERFQNSAITVELQPFCGRVVESSILTNDGGRPGLLLSIWSGILDPFFFRSIASTSDGASPLGRFPTLPETS